MSSEELLKLKWAFDGKQKQGTPVFHDVLSSLLREDLPTLDKETLLRVFYACSHSNPGRTNLQPDVIELLRPLFKQFTFEEKSIFLLVMSIATKGIKYNKKVHKKRKYEWKQYVASILLELDLWDLSLTHETVQQLVFALAKLHLEKTRFLTLPLKDYISEHLEDYCADKDRLFQAVAYLG